MSLLADDCMPLGIHIKIPYLGKESEKPFYREMIYNEVNKPENLEKITSMVTGLYQDVLKRYQKENAKNKK